MGQFFGYVSLTSGMTTQINIGAAGIAGLIIGNESGFTVVVSMQGNNFSKSLYPGTVDFFPVSWGFTGVVTFAATTLLSNASSWPGSYLQVDIVGLNEAVSGQYPFALARIYNIGNEVSTNMGAATSIVNAGNTPGTLIIDSTTGADASQSVTLTNDGTLVLGNTIGRVGSLTLHGAGAITTDGAISSSLVSGTGLSIGAASSLDNGAIVTDGSGDITANGSVTIGGHFSMGQNPSVQTIGAAGSINVGLEGFIEITMTANRSSCVLQPGTHGGQFIAVVNKSAFVLTFATVATSNVQDGTNVTIQPFRMKTFIWDGNNSTWYSSQ